MISVDSATYVKWDSMQEEVSNATECFIFWAKKYKFTPVSTQLNIFLFSQ